MHATFEAEKNRKAFIYTVIICGILLLLFFFISWPIMQVSAPVAQDLIEINLGNNNDGMGDVQPLIKGAMAPYREATVQPQKAFAKDEPANQPQPDDNADKDAAPVIKTEKKANKISDVEKPIVQRTKTINTQKIITPKPQKPKFTYNGPGNGNGNGADQDNGYRYQGSKPGGTGDAGSPSGNPDSYGNDPGGRIAGGPRVTSGDRKIIRYYSFTGDLDKATINAIIKVSPEGVGSFVDFGKNSSSTNRAYATAISDYLRNMKFDKSEHESTVTVQFNFNVK
jgi:hypothetical protein